METINMNNPDDLSNKFSKILWHDTKIYAFALDDETFQLSLDIDNILNWTLLDGESYYTFDVIPTNLIFGGVHGLKIDLSDDRIIVEDATCISTGKKFNALAIWEINITTLSGDLSFNATTFNIKPWGNKKTSSKQIIGLAERGGINLQFHSLRPIDSAPR